MKLILVNCSQYFSRKFCNCAYCTIGKLNILLSKLICAEVSKTAGSPERVFHQTVNAQNSMLTMEIHDQGKIN